jgi:hypothetical protein
MSNNHIGLQCNKFFGEDGSTLGVTGCPTMVNLQVAAVHPPPVCVALGVVRPLLIALPNRSRQYSRVRQRAALGPPVAHGPRRRAPINVMNSRRLRAHQLRRVIVSAATSAWYKIAIKDRTMSALGQKQTHALQQRVFAKGRKSWPAHDSRRSILLLLQHTHLRTGSGPPFLHSVERPSLRIGASSSPCHLASSFLVRWPLPVLMRPARETLRRKSQILSDGAYA